MWSPLHGCQHAMPTCNWWVHMHFACMSFHTCAIHEFHKPTSACYYILLSTKLHYIWRSCMSPSRWSPRTTNQSHFRGCSFVSLDLIPKKGRLFLEEWRLLVPGTQQTCTRHAHTLLPRQHLGRSSSKCRWTCESNQLAGRLCIHGNIAHLGLYNSCVF